ncbi:hypothetical protein EVAR_56134_1 [Eumeta japonica]|uniref:Secreted protein n=1 Tax=Eumeta variegata TaxID=151549 RepID=A0A4C1ZQ89_EUMVA|nr:hypothetical protein EVAR_56134_1 [Eumeta japonica]
MTGLIHIVYIVRLLRSDILLFLPIIPYNRDRIGAIVPAHRWPSVTAEECSVGNWIAKRAPCHPQKKQVGRLLTVTGYHLCTGSGESVDS